MKRGFTGGQKGFTTEAGEMILITESGKQFRWRFPKVLKQN